MEKLKSLHSGISEQKGGNPSDSLEEEDRGSERLSPSQQYDFQAKGKDCAIGYSTGRWCLTQNYLQLKVCEGRMTCSDLYGLQEITIVPLPRSHGKRSSKKDIKHKEWKKQWRREELYPQANELQEREQTSWRASWKTAQNGAEWIETDGLSGDRTIFQTPGGKLWAGRPTREAGDLGNRLKISCCLLQVLLVKPAVQNIHLLQSVLLRLTSESGNMLLRA